MKKTCRRCEKQKPIEKFSVRKMFGKEYPQAYCKPCMVERTNDWKKKQKNET